MSQYILGIDQGTTGTKVYVFGERGEIGSEGVQGTNAVLSPTRLGRT